MLSPDEIQAILNLGVPGLLLVAVIAFQREWVVPGTVAKRYRDERDEAYDRVDRLTDVVEAATGIKAPK